jgi:prolipoprotein diacylglyceryltransferase
VAPSAVIALSFDPIALLGDIAVRWETIAVAVIIFAAIVVAGTIARRTPVDPTRPADAPGEEPGTLNRLRNDDLLYIAVSALPGAVIGARLGYWLIHLDYYGGNVLPLLDIGQGGFQLSLGVVGGIITSSMVAGLLGAPLGRWLHALVLPVLLALAGGKLAMALGGSGQGLPSDASFATAYTGLGPWGSLAPAIPSHPSQVYEAIATVFVLLIVMIVLAAGAFRGRNGGAFLLAIGLWAVARGLVATTWRDPEVLGPLRADQVISIAIASVSFVLLILVAVTSRVRTSRRGPDEGGGRQAQGGVARPAGASEAGGEGPAWPDPTSRPRI